MNISYNWLQDLIEFSLTPNELGEQLTRVGLAVEGIHPFGDDHVLDIDLTSNRPDCLSHLGMAREIGVITDTALSSGLYSQAADNSDVPLPPVLAGEVVTINEPELCRRFTARIIRGVKIGPSPDWLVNRLEAIGERSINNVADITNFVMHECGQPMHAFDLDKLSGERIIVRLARPGETVTTLDEIERKLDTEMLAICDADKAISIAGIMGGLESGITESTTDVLLEVANFKRENIRRTSRDLGLTTEASYRFERGVDISNVVRASDRAADLIMHLAGGTAEDLIDVYPTRRLPTSVESTDISSAVRRLTGLEVDTDNCDRILAELGIERVAGTNEYIAPSWRHDISIEEDLVEEVARHTGYENIATELPPAYGAGEYHDSEPPKLAVRNSLLGAGFQETITYSFIDTKYDTVYEPLPEISSLVQSHGPVTLRDSVIEGALRMRQTILPGMLETIRLNFNQQRRDLKLFEIGRVFASSGDGLPPFERDAICIAITGAAQYADRALSSDSLDLFDMKGSVESILDSVGVKSAIFRPVDVLHLQPGQAAEVTVDGETIGYLGALADSIIRSLKLKQPVFVAEIDLPAAIEHASPTPSYRPLPRYPSVVRDVSLLAERSVPYADLAAAAKAFIGNILKGVSFVDVYEGAGLPSGYRSITIRLEYRSDDHTLSESEVDELHQQIISAVEDRTGAKPR